MSRLASPLWKYLTLLMGLATFALAQADDEVELALTGPQAGNRMILRSATNAEEAVGWILHDAEKNNIKQVYVVNGLGQPLEEVTNLASDPRLTVGDVDVPRVFQTFETMGELRNADEGAADLIEQKVTGLEKIFRAQQIAVTAIKTVIVGYVQYHIYIEKFAGQIIPTLMVTVASMAATGICQYKINDIAQDFHRLADKLFSSVPFLKRFAVPIEGMAARFYSLYDRTVKKAGVTVGAYAFSLVYYFFLTTVFYTAAGIYAPDQLLKSIQSSGIDAESLNFAIAMKGFFVALTVNAFKDTFADFVPLSALRKFMRSRGISKFTERSILLWVGAILGATSSVLIMNGQFGANEEIKWVMTKFAQFGFAYYFVFDLFNREFWTYSLTKMRGLFEGFRAKFSFLGRWSRFFTGSADGENGRSPHPSRAEASAQDSKPESCLILLMRENSRGFLTRRLI